MLDREMGCTRRELLRVLPDAIGNAPALIEGDEVTHRLAVGELQITMREAPPRRLALLALPVLAVRFRFLGVGEADREAFLARFDAYTRRGGG